MYKKHANKRKKQKAKGLSVTGSGLKLSGQGQSASGLELAGQGQHASGLKLSGQGLELAGQGQSAKGLKLTGQGKKRSGCVTVMDTSGGAYSGGESIPNGVIEYGVEDAIRHLKGTPSIKGVVGAAIIGGLSSYLYKKMRNKMQGKGDPRKTHVTDIMLKILKRAPKHLSIHPSKLNHDHVLHLLHQHKNKPVHIKEIYGDIWKKKGNDLINKIIMMQSGKGIGDWIKKGYKSLKGARDKAFHKLKDFAAGKTKFTPSKLLNYMSSAVGAAGAASALIPGVDLISVPTASALALGLKSASLAAKTSGRGNADQAAADDLMDEEDEYDFDDSGENINHGGGAAASLMPILNNLAQYNDALTKTKLGVLLGLTGAALTGAYKLYKSKTKNKKGGAMKIPIRVQNYVKKNPAVAKRIAKLVGNGSQQGYGKASQLVAALGLAGTSGAAGAYMFYKYLLDNPAYAAKLATKAGMNVASKYLGGKYVTAKKSILHKHSGEGEYMANQRKLERGVSMLGNGKIKRDKYSVFHGYHKKTASGKTKDDYMLNKRGKVISRKKHEQGMRMMQQGKGIFAK